MLGAPSVQVSALRHTHAVCPLTTAQHTLTDVASSCNHIMAGIVPPFTAETAQKKVKIAQDLWNTKNPEKVSLAYTVRGP